MRVSCPLAGTVGTGTDQYPSCNNFQLIAFLSLIIFHILRPLNLRSIQSEMHNKLLYMHTSGQTLMAVV